MIPHSITVGTSDLHHFMTYLMHPTQHQVQTQMGGIGRGSSNAAVSFPPWMGASSPGRSGDLDPCDVVRLGLAVGHLCVSEGTMEIAL